LPEKDGGIEVERFLAQNHGVKTILAPKLGAKASHYVLETLDSVGPVNGVWREAETQIQQISGLLSFCNLLA